MKKTLFFLMVIGLIALYGLFACSGEPVVAILKGTVFEGWLNAVGYQNAILFNLSVGYLTSLFFWYALVYFPEKKNKQRCIDRFRTDYESFRLNTIKVLYSAADQYASCANSGEQHSRYVSDEELLNRISPEQLLDPIEFRKFFMGKNKQNWYGALNYLGNADEDGSSYQRDELFFELGIFSQKIHSFLEFLEPQDSKSYEFFVNLEQRIIYFSNDRHNIQYIGNLLLEINARWDRLTRGALQTDPVDDFLIKMEKDL